MQPAMDAGDSEHRAEPAVRKGPWTMEEDRVLVSYVAAHGEGYWNNLARAAGLSRTGKSCRLRWLNYLRPDVRRGGFTIEEQEVIVRLHATWGNKWSRIAKNLPAGRTDNEVKNFWRTKIQKKKKNSNRNKQRSTVGSIIAAGACRVDDKSTPAITESQGSGNSGQTGVTSHDYGILEQTPNVSSMDCQQGYDAHAGGNTSAGGAMDCFFPPEFLAASGENFWAIDEFWSMVQSFQGNSS